MVKYPRRNRNYRKERREEEPWLEIVRYKKKKVVTPMDKLKKELELIEELRYEEVKSSEVEKITPKLNELIAEETEAIKKLTSLYELTKKISFVTGMLEPECRILGRMIKEKAEHKKKLEYMLKDLTK